jgi:hypothetical protein
MWIQKDRLVNYPLGTDFNGNVLNLQDCYNDLFLIKAN